MCLSRGFAQLYFLSTVNILDCLIANAFITRISVLHLMIYCTVVLPRNGNKLSRKDTVGTQEQKHENNSLSSSPLA